MPSRVLSSRKGVMCSEPAALEIPPPFGSPEREILRWDSKSKSYLERSKSYVQWQEVATEGAEGNCRLIPFFYFRL
jgi:hypothetical protein